ncbi:DUF1702 family protein [Streptosporangium sp. NBC_01756]|uniref:DUF1702 family protein n=1 Tax=Streptosporangium sp. NBC_01756 TaxID=2975950 RepID=UPI002DD87F83|nr:DUF1702 family protein [Streptosporangium sp. NBC_01756]WSC89024.1 DUF1702 family protein [Streptosporangium sp. NBC_01756]
MSNAEGTRTVAQSDGAEQGTAETFPATDQVPAEKFPDADQVPAERFPDAGQGTAERFPDADRVPVNDGNGSEVGPDADGVSDTEITAEMERVPYPEETGSADVLVAGRVSGTRGASNGERAPASAAEPAAPAERTGVPETPSPERSPGAAPAPVPPTAPASPTAPAPVPPTAPASPTAPAPVPPTAPASPTAPAPVPPTAPASPTVQAPAPPIAHASPTVRASAPPTAPAPASSVPPVTTAPAPTPPTAPAPPTTQAPPSATAPASPAATAPAPWVAPAVPTPVSPAELELTRPRGLPGLFWQDLAQVDSGPRRFRLGPARERLETANQSFLTGFNAMVAGEVERIEDIHEELRGAAYEGAGMACAMLDVLTITGGRRLRSLLSGPGLRYPHMVHLGTGWAYARLRMRPMWGIRSVHPLLRWLAFDGFGFHQGFFSTDRTVGRQRTAGLMDRTRRAIFDQGLGRMLWFHECAGADDVIRRIAEFPPGRRADLWSGVGMAATYTGGAGTAELERLIVAAAEDGFRAHLVQGSAFACACRLISGIVPEHTAAATPVLCGVEVDEAAAWTDTALIALGHNAHSGDHYQAWRAGIRKAWARRNRDS